MRGLNGSSGHVAGTAYIGRFERLDELQDGSRQLLAVSIHLVKRLIIDEAHSVSSHDLTSHLSAGAFGNVQEVDKLLIALAFKSSAILSLTDPAEARIC